MDSLKRRPHIALWTEGRDLTAVERDQIASRLERAVAEFNRAQRAALGESPGGDASLTDILLDVRRNLAEACSRLYRICHPSAEQAGATRASIPVQAVELARECMRLVIDLIVELDEVQGNAAEHRPK